MPARSANDVRIETYSGPRVNLRPLFKLAEDSVAEADSYRGRVWLDPGGLLLLGSPPAVEVGELVSHLRSQVLGFEPTGQADRLAHLGQVLGAVGAGRPGAPRSGAWPWPLSEPSR